jgi:hypothetical protein
MALQTLSKTGITNNSTVEAWHVTQSVDAFTGQVGYDITISGSFALSDTTGSGLWGETLRVDMDNSGFGNGNYTIPFLRTSGSGFGTFKYSETAPKYNPIADVLYVTSSQAISSSQAASASYTQYGTNNLSVGAFYDTSTQTLASNVSGAMTFNSITVSDGISVTSNSRLTVTKSGTYNIQFSSQFTPAGPGSSVYVWLRKNGTNVAYSNTEISMQNSNDAYVAAWNFVETLTAGQYVELIWYPVGGTVDMTAAVPTPGAGGNGNIGIPSVIVTMTQIK